MPYRSGKPHIASTDRSDPPGVGLGLPLAIELVKWAAAGASFAPRGGRRGMWNSFRYRFANRFFDVLAIPSRSRPVLMRRRASNGPGRSRTFGLLSRAGGLVIAGASLASFTASFAAPAGPTGGPSSPPAGSDQASFLQSLAGPEEAPMYPSGLIWDPSFPTTGGSIPVVVVADTGYNRISIYDPTACPVPDTSTCAPIESSSAPKASATASSIPIATSRSTPTRTSTSPTRPTTGSRPSTPPAPGCGVPPIRPTAAESPRAGSPRRSASAMTPRTTRSWWPTPATPRSRHLQPSAAHSDSRQGNTSGSNPPRSQVAARGSARAGRRDLGGGLQR